MQLIKEKNILAEQIKNICENAVIKHENNLRKKEEKDESFCIHDGFTSGKSSLAKEILKLLKENLNGF